MYFAAFSASNNKHGTSILSTFYLDKSVDVLSYRAMASFFWEFGQQTKLETLEKDQTRKNTFGWVWSRDG